MNTSLKLVIRNIGHISFNVSVRKKNSKFPLSFILYPLNLIHLLGIT